MCFVALILFKLRAALGWATAGAAGAALLRGLQTPRAATPHTALVPAAGLGAAFGTGVALTLLAPAPHLGTWGLYVAALAFFHWSEYLTTALFNRDRLAFESFLLDHSVAYGAAAVASWCEFWLEARLLPAALLPAKAWRPAVAAGLALVLVGEATRKLAMFTARHNFSHLIATERRADHVLVTHGVYALSRHPSYMGWFWWAVGTQVLLCNPVCAVAYAAVTWRFFRERIDVEERLLLSFFGPAYDAYQQRVGTGIPGLAGVRVAPAQRAWWAAQAAAK
jgi:protein-S-isoprenylcysteine O-methyltransferase